MATIMIHYNQDKLPRVDVHDLSAPDRVLFSLNLRVKEDDVSMFFKERADLFRFANSITRAAAGILPSQQDEERPHKPEGDQIIICGKCNTVTIDGKCWCKGIPDCPPAIPPSQPDGPIADSVDGYRITQEEVLVHDADCDCGDCVENRRMEDADCRRDERIDREKDAV